ncbi:hypothetical protein GO755_39885 [Spirosoma sp. HMF4905]|uniref:Uncharacterized protein n=1 Tax=Spirosoma arboris TaxID=2682092 RepID=A0A7K1SR31_9BACT|nr:hypothetical protein [Spirosoma arboris]MVM36239.1 hypothetical protein [Spirosoma arboris]
MGKKIWQTKTTRNLIFGILAGLIAYMIIGKLGLYLLHIGWADYATHSKDKSYTLGMLLSRLFIGLVASITASITTTKIANDNGKSAWFVGAVVFCVGSYIHFLTTVWGDYPSWYHFAYVLPIIPITGLSNYLLAKENRFNSEC